MATALGNDSGKWDTLLGIILGFACGRWLQRSARKQMVALDRSAPESI